MQNNLDYFMCRSTDTETIQTRLGITISGRKIGNFSTRMLCMPLVFL